MSGDDLTRRDREQLIKVVRQRGRLAAASIVNVRRD